MLLWAWHFDTYSLISSSGILLMVGIPWWNWESDREATVVEGVSSVCWLPAALSIFSSVGEASVQAHTITLSIPVQS